MIESQGAGVDIPFRDSATVKEVISISLAVLEFNGAEVTLDDLPAYAFGNSVSVAVVDVFELHRAVSNDRFEFVDVVVLHIDGRGGGVNGGLVSVGVIRERVPQVIHR